MQLQRIRTSDNQEAWLVLDTNYLPVESITEFIRYLVNTEKSPNTIRSYANHLRLYWEFLEANHYDWLTVTIDHFSRFVHWLRSSHSNVICVNTRTTWHTASSVNTILSVIASFYRFHQQCGRTNVSLTKLISCGSKKTYSILHHIFKRYPQRRKIIKLREPKDLPKTLTSDEVKVVSNSCKNVKERLLVTILAETGMRIGQLLGLQHQDVKSWDNKLHIVPRRTNSPDAQAKRKSLHVIHDNFLFTKHNKQEGLTYSYVRQFFLRLAKIINKPITPHMLRHTHATELLRSGWDAAYVQKRLGHAHVVIACIARLVFPYRLGANPTKNNDDKFRVARATHIIFLLFYTGIRIAEAAEHKMGNFILRDNEWFLRVVGKGRKSREIPIPDELLAAMAYFRKAIGLSSPTPVYREQTALIPMKNLKDSISTRRISQILKWAFDLGAMEYNTSEPNKASKLRVASAHWLRHSYVTYLLESGATLKVAQENAGHSNVATTMHYQHVNQTNRHEQTRLLSLNETKGL